MAEICFFTSVCEADYGHVSRYLREVERLDMPFVVHFDRCHIPEMADHHLCDGFTYQYDPAIEFEERHKQAPLNKVVSLAYDWACMMDIDETWEFDILEKFKRLDQLGADYVDTRWLNLWGDWRHVRVDSNYALGHRVKLFNLKSGLKWEFDHPITNGPKTIGAREPVLATCLDMVCLHWGMMTQEDRLHHKARWDRIYSTALRGDQNPYGFWKNACDETIKPILVKHGYFQ